MDASLLVASATSLVLWIVGLPVLWVLVRGTPEKPAPLRGLKAEVLMLVHLLLLLLAVSTLIMGSGIAT